jgi:hypothetical protein
MLLPLLFMLIQRNVRGLLSRSGNRHFADTVQDGQLRL